MDSAARSLTRTTGAAPTSELSPDPGAAAPAADLGRLERWLRRRPVAAAGAALILLHLAIRASWVSDTWFAEDDYTWITGSFQTPLTWELVTRDVAGHSLIGCWVVSWLITAADPMERWPAGVVILGLLALSAVLFWRLLRRLFGERPAVLVPLTLYLFWAMTTTTSIWWSNVVLSIPLQICISAALLAQLRYLRTRRIRDVVVSAAVLAVGLLFFSKAVVIPVVVFAFTVFYGFGGSLWRRLGQTIRLGWPVWVAHLLLLVAYTGLYLRTVVSVHHPPSSVSKLVDLARNLVVTSFNTLAWGGPWSWGEGTTAQTAYAAPPSFMVWIAGALTLAVIALSLSAGTRALLAWTLLLGYLAIDVAMLASARLAFIGAQIGLTERYLSELAVIAALVVGLAFLPLQGPGAPPDTARPGPTVGPMAWFAQHPALLNVGVTVAVTAVAVSGSISAQDLSQRWADHAGKKYFATLRADLRAMPDRPDMFDGPVPPQVISPLVTPANLLSAVTRPMPERPRFPRSTYSFVTPDNTGELRRGTVNGISSRPGPTAQCGWLVQGGKVAVIPLEKSVLEWQWVVKIAYYSNNPSRAQLTFGDRTTEVTLRSGLNDFFVSVMGGGDSIRISGVRPGVTICVGQVVVGVAAAAAR